MVPQDMKRRVREYLEEVGIQVVDWPPRSPHLGFTGHLRHFFKRRLTFFHIFQTTLVSQHGILFDDI
jgi:8-oxo-dGTP pyrophosphatase MutT (NUDIX family)